MKAHKAVTAARTNIDFAINFSTGESVTTIAFKSFPPTEVLRWLDGMMVNGQALSLTTKQTTKQATKLTDAAKATDGPFAFLKGQF